MNQASIVELTDVPGCSRVKMDLPVPLRLGDRITLAFQLRRNLGGRSEVLDVTGEFRVTSVAFDTSNGPARQILKVDSLGKAPTWRAVKKQPAGTKKIGPTRFPPTIIS